MYANELLNAYKEAQKYVQDKQIAHDLNLQPNKISKIRKGIRYVTDEEAVFLAEGAGIEKEIALLGCHADRNANPNIKAMWANIAKKYNGLGLSGITMACGGFALWIMQTKDVLAHTLECALYPLMLNSNKYNINIRPFELTRVMYAPPRNERKLRIS